MENRASVSNIDNETLLKEYLSGKSLTKISNKFHCNRSKISNRLKSLGISVINKQNQTLFNENVFDVIDTEEKAY